MPQCKKCNTQFPNFQAIEGKNRNLSARRYCINCSPFGKHNTRNLTIDKTYNDKERHCTTCQILKPITQYYWKPKEQRYHSACKECFKKQIKDIQIRNKLKAINYLGGICKKCGFDTPQALIFHHRNGMEDKEFIWTQMKGKSWEKIKKELDKCDVLCANCHLIHHAGNWNIAL